MRRWLRGLLCRWDLMPHSFNFGKPLSTPEGCVCVNCGEPWEKFYKERF